ncbi:F-box-like protein [Ceratobasidium sp. AG-Ba]|nr:F-box-like protein [Ceratobasidium sp. AG-Ba]
MFRHRSSAEIAAFKLQNNSKSINKLPNELLAQIFALGDEDRRSRRSKGYKYYGFQDIATEVCSHWHAVATNSPSLWTYIFISRPPPHRSAELYLSRAGSALLNLDLDFTTDFYRRYYEVRRDDDQGYKAARALGTINILEQYGATPDRWRSFILCGWVPKILYETVQYIHSVPCSSLRFLSIGWKTMMCDLPIMYEGTSSIEFSDYDNPNFNSKDLFPQLRTVYLNMFPVRFLLKRPLPMLSGLRHLNITPGFQQLSLAGLHTVLSSNPELNALSIYPGYAEHESFEPSTDLLVSLPLLRSLTLDSTGGNFSLIMKVMKMILCPGLDCLELIFPAGMEADLVGQILDRSYSTYDIYTGDESPPTPDDNEQQSKDHLYPELKRLTLSYAYQASRAFDTSDLLSALPTITFLAAPNHAIELLDKRPILLPMLKHIKIPNEPPKNLCKILNWRAKQNVFVDILEISEKYLDLVGSPLPRSLTVVKVPTPSSTRFCRESRVRKHNSRDYDDCSDPYGNDDDNDDDPFNWSDF